MLRLVIGPECVRLVSSLLVVAGGIGPWASLAAQDSAVDSLSLAELEERIDILTLEIEELRLGADVVARADTSVLGLGPAASKIYGITEGVSIGGYGEILYENFADPSGAGEGRGKPAQADALRAIVYVGYKFDDRFLLNTEIEVEHGSTSQAGSASLEFAYLDYRLAEGFGIRGGLLLSPMGFVNELHEPPVFFGAKRPDTETRIIPTTWRENGIGIFGETGSLGYRVYVMNSLDGVGGGTSRAGGFSASGLRGGRQKGSKAMAEDFSVVGRADWSGILGLTLGASLYVGNSGHGRTLGAGDPVDARTMIWEGHVAFRARGFDARALLAVADVDQAAELNRLKGLTGTASVGRRLSGAYAQLGYDLLNRAATSHQLIPFFRYETLDTQAAVPRGFESNPANDTTVLTLGLSWKPRPQIVAKTDYQIREDGASAGVNQFNVALGYLF